MLATGMTMLNAVGTSLLAVGAFGLATALSYAASGLVDWIVAAEFIAGGVAGGALGMRAALHLGRDRATLNRIFAGLVLTVAVWIIWRNTLGA